MTKSATVLNNNLTISGHVRPEKLPGGLGLNMISKGILVITVGQLLGWIRDATDSYVLGLHAQNGLLLLVIVIWTPEIVYRYRHHVIEKRSAKQKKTLDVEQPQQEEEKEKCLPCNSTKSDC